jgi:membrane fusion protein (multidrug efflux system)
MNPIIKRIVYVVLIIFILGIIIYPKLDLSKEEANELTSSNPAPTSSKLTVEAVKVSYKPLDYAIRVTGTIMADEEVTLTSEVSARVDKIQFKEGMNVSKGQLLVSLNDDELQAELEKLQYNKKLFEDAEFRQRKLLESEAISREEYEVALTTLNTALAEIKLLETRKDKHKIRAPFSGTIGLRDLSEGTYITPGTSIANIYRIDPVKIDFQIPGRYLKDINTGDRLVFTVDGYEEDFDGVIYAIEPQIDPKTRSIKLRARSKNPNGKLLPGQFVKIRLILDQIQETIMVPTIAVIPELNATKVFIYNDGIVESRAVETGIRTESEVQIVSGLKPGDVVITSGLLQIRNGSEVNVSL